MTDAHESAADAARDYDRKAAEAAASAALYNADDYDVIGRAAANEPQARPAVYVVVEIDVDGGENLHRAFADAAKAEALAAKIRNEIQYGDVYVTEADKKDYVALERLISLIDTRLAEAEEVSNE